jgi:anti-repressor protein
MEVFVGYPSSKYWHINYKIFIMNSIKLFNFDNKQIRIISTDENEPLFCLVDLCNALELSNARVVAQRIDEDELRKLDLRGQVGETNFVTEAGMYMVILRSDSLMAKPFQKWVVKEVLPSIRKQGAYMTPETIEKALNNPDFIIELANRLKQANEDKERALRQLAISFETIKHQAPKVEYYDNVMQSRGLIATNIIAKDLGMSAIGLNKMLHAKGIIYQCQGVWIPYSKYQDRGYCHSQTFPFHDKKGNPISAIHYYWTEKGREFIMKLFQAKKIA